MHQKIINKKFKKTLLVVITLYVMIGASLYTLQEKMLFLPTVLPQDYSYKFENPFDELFLESEDGAIINALHFKNINPKGVILYFHGNAGDLSRWGFIAEYFVKMNYDVLIMDYRTYGKSIGTLSEEALYIDGQKCYEFLKELYAENDIILYGRSLGSGIASKLAADNKPKQLILETPFYSIEDVARHRFPIFPVKSLLKYKFPNFEHLKKVNCTTSIFHGTEDKVVPFKSGEKLFKSLDSNKANFFIIEKGGHNNLVNFESYHKNINRIL